MELIADLAPAIISIAMAVIAAVITWAVAAFNKLTATNDRLAAVQIDAERADMLKRAAQTAVEGFLLDTIASGQPITIAGAMASFNTHARKSIPGTLEALSPSADVVEGIVKATLTEQVTNLTGLDSERLRDFLRNPAGVVGSELRERLGLELGNEPTAPANPNRVY